MFCLIIIGGLVDSIRDSRKGATEIEAFSPIVALPLDSPPAPASSYGLTPHLPTPLPFSLHINLDLFQLSNQLGDGVG